MVSHLKYSHQYVTTETNYAQVMKSGSELQLSYFAVLWQPDLLETDFTCGNPQPHSIDCVTQ